MVTRARFRSRAVPRTQPSTFPIGIARLEYRDTVNSRWKLSHNHPYNATYTAERLYSTVEKTWDRVNWPGPPYLTGGSFDNIRGSDQGLNLIPWKTDWCYTTNGLFRIKYEGLAGPNWYPPSPFTLRSGVNFDTQLPDLSSYGPQAFNMYSPVKPKVDLGTFIGEIREIPAMFIDLSRRFKDVWKLRGGHPRYLRPRNAKPNDVSLANDFLEYQFGWVPFVTSLIDFHRTMCDLAKHVRRIIDFNGKWEGRGGPVVDELISESVFAKFTSTDGMTFPSGLSSIFGSTATTTVYKRVYRSVWFHGYFRFYIPRIAEQELWQPDIFRLILGLNISPALLWNITPWSWLVDWFGNIGTILENARDADIFNLTHRNAFMMAKSDIRFDFSTTRSTRGGGFSHTWPYVYQRKQRVPAAPYGLSVDFGPLSNVKKAIMGALALTKLRS